MERAPFAHQNQGDRALARPLNQQAQQQHGNSAPQEQKRPEPVARDMQAA